MVETRSQRRRKLLTMEAESQAGSSHDAKDATMAFIEKVLEKMEDLEAFNCETMEKMRWGGRRGRPDLLGRDEHVCESK